MKDLNPNDEKFFTVASGLIAHLMDKIPDGHHVTLIIRHQTDIKSGVVITSEETEKEGAVDTIVEALRRGLAKPCSAVCHVEDPPKPSNN